MFRRAKWTKTAPRGTPSRQVAAHYGNGIPASGDSGASDSARGRGLSRRRQKGVREPGYLPAPSQVFWTTPRMRVCQRVADGAASLERTRLRHGFRCLQGIYREFSAISAFRVYFDARISGESQGVARRIPCEAKQGIRIGSAGNCSCRSGTVDCRSRSAKSGLSATGWSVTPLYNAVISYAACYSESRQSTHSPPALCDLTAASMNFTPRAPSITVG